MIIIVTIIIITTTLNNIMLKNKSHKYKQITTRMATEQTDCSIVTVWKRLVGALPHEHPLLLGRVIMALDDLVVVRTQFFGRL